MYIYIYMCACHIIAIYIYIIFSCLVPPTPAGQWHHGRRVARSLTCHSGASRVKPAEQHQPRMMARTGGRRAVGAARNQGISARNHARQNVDRS